jgi:hypothetical protein
MSACRYWIVDIDAQAVERWTPRSETPEILRDRIVWTPPNAAPFSLDLSAYSIASEQSRVCDEYLGLKA